MKAPPPKEFPLRWMKTVSFTCTKNNSEEDDDWLFWTIAGICKAENSSPVEEKSSPDEEKSSPVKEKSSPDEEKSSPDEEKSSSVDKSLNPEKLVLHSVNIFSEKLMDKEQIEILKFMSVNDPQYVFIKKSKAKFGHLQKVYSDTGIKQDQRSVRLCRIKKDKDEMQFWDNLTIRFDFKIK